MLAFKWLFTFFKVRCSITNCNCKVFCKYFFYNKFELYVWKRLFLWKGHLDWINGHFWCFLDFWLDEKLFGRNDESENLFLKKYLKYEIGLEWAIRNSGFLFECKHWLYYSGIFTNKLMRILSALLKSGLILCKCYQL